MPIQPFANSQLNYLNTQDRFQRRQLLNSEFDWQQTFSRIKQTNQIFLTNPSHKKLLASYIYLINSSSSIKTEEGSFTEHYQRFNQLFKSATNLYPDEFIKDSIYTLRNTWATDQGTLGYYLNFSYPDFKYHYLSPGELGFYSTVALLKQSKITTQAKLKSLYDRYLNLANEPTEINAVEFYNLTTDIWQALGLQPTFKLLSFMANFLPRLNRWYLDLDKTKVLTPIETILQDLALVCIQANLDFKPKPKTNLIKDFCFSELPPIYFTVFRKVIEQRSLTLDNIKIDSLNENLPAEKLYKEYLINIALNTKPNLIKEKSLYLLENLAPAGGLNLILLATANFLLANAYNLIIKDPQAAEINKLIYIAGYSLSKSNLNKLKVIGFNLIVFSNLDIPLDPAELLNLQL